MLDKQAVENFCCETWLKSFRLMPADFKKKLLFFPAQYSDAAAELKKQGLSMVCADPHYPLTTVIERQLLSAVDPSAEKTCFIKDYLQQGPDQYVAASLPQLPWRAFQFDVLVSYQAFFVEAADWVFVLKEYCRVAKEVRICQVDQVTDEQTQALLEALVQMQAENFGVEINPVQPQSDVKSLFLRIWAQRCVVDHS